METKPGRCSDGNKISSLRLHKHKLKTRLVMATIIGNIFLFLASLLFIGFTTVLYGSSSARGGDAGVGNVWGVIYFNLAFLACMTVVTIAIAWNGGFEWIAPDKSTRYFLVAFGFLSAIIATTICGLFKDEPGSVPLLVRFFSGFGPALIPFVMLAASAILLNEGLRASVPVFVYKWPLMLIFAISLITIAASIAGWMADSARRQSARMEETISSQDENHRRMLAEIDSCDVSKNMVFILVFADANQHADVRENAVAKIRTNPNWEQELIRLLECDWAPEAFNFLASNPIDHPDLFLEPVRQGVLNQARLIRESIRRSSHPSHFDPDLFSWEVERALRTVDRFNGSGTDYKPDVQALRAALDEPSEYKQKTTLRCVSTVDNWLKSH
jgi:hypothetical protein